MILVVTGSSSYPFDRLISTMDGLARKYGYDMVIQTGVSEYPVTHARHFKLIGYDEFIRYYRDADLIVAHPSTGPLLYAREFEKPVIVMPRYASKGELTETLETHQLDISKALAAEDEPMRSVVFDEHELEPAVARMLTMSGKSYNPGTGLALLRKSLREELDLA